MTVKTNPSIRGLPAPPLRRDVENGGIRVLIVESEAGPAAALQANLEARGCVVMVAADGPAAIELLASQDPDIILLDTRVHGREGTLERRLLLWRIRQSSSAPVIFLAAPTGVADAVVGLSMGADDYVVKPVAVRELMARMQAILRRVGHNGGQASRLAV